MEGDGLFILNGLNGGVPGTMTRQLSQGMIDVVSRAKQGVPQDPGEPFDPDLWKKYVDTSLKLGLGMGDRTSQQAGTGSGNPSGGAAGQPSHLKTILIVGALGIGGFLLYRHMKKGR